VEGTRVRRLEERDIDAAIALTDLEGWGYTRADFQRLLALSPDGCLAAELRGRVVGVLTTTTYDALAFLGAVIVSPELRGKGVGKQMMEAALDHLRQRGVRTVRLNAYLNAVPFYERLGFHGDYEVIRWHGRATGRNARNVRPIHKTDIDSLIQLDTVYFGANRRTLLARLAKEFPETFLVGERSGHLKGFIVGSAGGDSCEIGPWVVEPDAMTWRRDVDRLRAQARAEYPRWMETGRLPPLGRLALVVARVGSALALCQRSATTRWSATMTMSSRSCGTSGFHFDGGSIGRSRTRRRVSKSSWSD